MLKLTLSLLLAFFPPLSFIFSLSLSHTHSVYCSFLFQSRENPFTPFPRFFFLFFSFLLSLSLSLHFHCTSCASSFDFSPADFPSFIFRETSSPSLISFPSDILFFREFLLSLLSRPRISYALVHESLDTCSKLIIVRKYRCSFLCVIFLLNFVCVYPLVRSKCPDVIEQISECTRRVCCRERKINTRLRSSRSMKRRNSWNTERRVKSRNTRFHSVLTNFERRNNELECTAHCRRTDCRTIIQNALRGTILAAISRRKTRRTRRY